MWLVEDTGKWIRGAACGIACKQIAECDAAQAQGGVSQEDAAIDRRQNVIVHRRITAASWFRIVSATLVAAASSTLFNVASFRESPTASSFSAFFGFAENIAASSSKSF